MGVIVDTIDFPNPGVFIFHDNENYPRFTYLGAAGIISVESSVPDARFFWNLHEFNRLWNLNPDSAQTMNWLNFNPDYFTVNGASYPFIDADSSAKIRGAVGDTIYIYCANTGRSVHSIHFHGYHCRILHSSKNNQQVNWVKDSQAVWPMETVLFELVPDKPGLFPVHDHNLMALTANLYYSNGIMIMMHIQ